MPVSSANKTDCRRVKENFFSIVFIYNHVIKSWRSGMLVYTVSYLVAVQCHTYPTNFSGASKMCEWNTANCTGQSTSLLQRICHINRISADIWKKGFL